jgi:hypothetical protein
VGSVLTGSRAMIANRRFVTVNTEVGRVREVQVGAVSSWHGARLPSKSLARREEFST